MKKIMSVLIASCLVLSLAACGNSAASTVTETETEIETSAAIEKEEETSVETVEETEKATEAETTSEDDSIEDDGWDQLEALGKIETENGIFTVSITLPADIVGEDVTQEQLDADAGDNYLSATLNDDGSATYKMTKKQHKTMMEDLTESIDSSIQDIVDSDDYAFTEIKHNDDFTQFDTVISTDEVGITETFMAYAFFIYSGYYGCFTGVTPDNVVVNFSDQNGNLITSINSADLEDAEETEVN